MTTQEIIAHLESKGIRSTVNRILVCHALADHQVPLSLSDLEDEIPDLDKSSIFRVLTLFREHDVVHAFEDGRGVVNYEFCGSHGHCHHDDDHLHFYCERCQRSYCLRDITMPDLHLPEGFDMHSASFVVKGICPNCKK